VRSKASKGGQAHSKSTHSGDRFKAKTGGDMKGKSKVEPYAYWPLDRRMLNKKRKGKQAQASKGLANIVKGAKAGAAKGRKAKRLRTG
jgi:ribosomal RNA-processing protein 12